LTIYIHTLMIDEVSLFNNCDSGNVHASRALTAPITRRQAIGTILTTGGAFVLRLSHSLA
jgi:hypothetical protein